MPNVSSSTGISIYVCEVNSSTKRMMPTAMSITICISSSSAAEAESPVSPVT